MVLDALEPVVFNGLDTGQKFVLLGEFFFSEVFTEVGEFFFLDLGTIDQFIKLKMSKEIVLKGDLKS